MLVMYSLIICFNTLIFIAVTSGVSCNDVNCNSCGYDKICKSQFDCYNEQFQSCLGCNYGWFIGDTSCAQPSCSIKFCMKCDQTSKYCDSCAEFFQLSLDGCTLKTQVIQIIVSISTILGFFFVFLYLHYRKQKRNQRVVNPLQNTENVGTNNSQPSSIHQNSTLDNQAFGKNALINIKTQDDLKHQCPICLEDKCKISTICGHHFHLICLFQWVKTKNCCPLCKLVNINVIYIKGCQNCENTLSYNILNVKNDKMMSLMNNKLCKACKIAKMNVI